MKLPVGFVLCAIVAAGAQDLSFEVASVKPSRNRDADSNVDSTPGRLTATNITVRELIRLAYGVKDYQMERAPRWIDDDRFDIAAKSSLGKTSREELGTQVRGLLTDRFRLAAHRETRQGSIFVLVVQPTGSKLKAHDEGTGSRTRAGCGRLSGVRLTADVIATALSRQLERDVVNRTNLPGKYDFELNWTPDAGACPGAVEGLPSIFGAIEQQMGLRLESVKGPVEVLVIDRVERPTEN